MSSDISNPVASDISLRTASQSSLVAPSFLSHSESTMPCSTVNPFFSAILTAWSSILLAKAQTAMWASILPNLALLNPRYPNDVTRIHLSADFLASYMWRLPSSGPARSSPYLLLFRRSMPSDCGTIPVLRHMLYPSSGTLFSDPGQQGHRIVSAEMFFFSIMLP